MTLALIMKLREHVGLLIGIIGVAIVSFLLMDAVNSSTNLFGNRQQNSIGSVEGEEVDIQDFNRYSDYVKSRISYFNRLWLDPNFSFTEDQLAQIRNSAWDEYVLNRVISKEAHALGLTVTPEEIDNRFYSPAPLREVSDFYYTIYPNAQAEGFNPETLRQLVEQILSFDLNDRQQQALREYYDVLRQYIAEQVLRSKYLALFSKSVFVPDWEAALAYKHTNETFDLSYITLPYSLINDADVAISDEDLEEYLADHRSEFSNKASVSFKYVIFDILPTREDSMEALNFVNEKIAKIKESGRDSLYVRQYSETPYNRGYFPQDEIETMIADSLFKVEPGTFIGPYLENGRYRVARVLDRKVLPDSVRVRTVFINRANYADADSMKLKMDEVRAAYEAGIPFDTLVARYSEDPSSISKGGDLGWFKPSNPTLTYDIYRKLFFQNNTGDVFESESPNGINFMEITGRGDEKEMVKYYILDREINPGEHTRNKVYAEVSRFATVYATSDSFDKGIEVFELTPRIAKDIPADAYKLPGINVSAREIIRWGLEAEPGEVKMFNNFEPTDDKYVIVQVTSVNTGEEPSVENLRPLLTQKVLREKKAAMLSDQMKTAMTGSSSLEQIAANLENSEVKTANSLTFNTQVIPGLGKDLAVIGSGYGIPKDVISDPFDGDRGVYIIQKTDMNELEIPEDLSVFKSQMENLLNNRFGNTLLQYMLDNADVSDTRYKYF